MPSLIVFGGDDEMAANWLGSRPMRQVFTAEVSNVASSKSGRAA